MNKKFFSFLRYEIIFLLLLFVLYIFLTIDIATGELDYNQNGNVCIHLKKNIYDTMYTFEELNDTFSNNFRKGDFVFIVFREWDAPLTYPPRLRLIYIIKL